MKICRGTLYLAGILLLFLLAAAPLFAAPDTEKAEGIFLFDSYTEVAIFETSGDQFDSDHLKNELISPPYANISNEIADQAMRIAEVKINLLFTGLGAMSFDADAGSLIYIDLFGDHLIRAQINRVEMDTNSVISITGDILEDDYGFFIHTVHEDRVLTVIELPNSNKQFQVVYDRRLDKHYMYEFILDEIDALPEGPTLDPPDRDHSVARDFSDLEIASDSSAMIDVMIVYTPEARTWADNNATSINHVISQAMERAQQAMDNSETLIDYTLVHSGEISYTEYTGEPIDYSETYGSGFSNCEGSLVDLIRLTQGTDGFDTAHSWRDTYGADLVALFSFCDTGGLGWTLRDSHLPSGNPDHGFSLTRVQQAHNSFTHVHEMGHNQGAGHHKDQIDLPNQPGSGQPGPVLYDYSAGWRWGNDAGNRRCSIMTYQSGSFFADGHHHQRVAHFSNPDITFGGFATGDAADGDNARTLRETRNIIAAYRPTTFNTLTVNSTKDFYPTSGVAISSTVTDYGGTTSYTRSIPQGTIVSLTAPVYHGSGAERRRFSSWGGDVESDNLTITFTMSADRTVTANYVKEYEIDVSIRPAENYLMGEYGRVAGADTYKHGDEVNLVAEPVADGFAFEAWIDGRNRRPVDGSPGAHYTFTAIEDRRLVASFMNILEPLGRTKEIIEARLKPGQRFNHIPIYDFLNEMNGYRETAGFNNLGEGSKLVFAIDWPDDILSGELLLCNLYSPDKELIASAESGQGPVIFTVDDRGIFIEPGDNYIEPGDNYFEKGIYELEIALKENPGRKAHNSLTPLERESEEGYPFWVYLGEILEQESEINYLSSLEIGDRVADYSWSWNYRTGDNYSGGGETKPVTWIVVAKDHYGPDSGVTLLAEGLIGRFTFDSSTATHHLGSNHWGDSGTLASGLRPWLNSTGLNENDGFYQAFSDNFKGYIMPASVPNKHWSSGVPYPTTDNVFIPSTTELGDETNQHTYEIGSVYPYFDDASRQERRTVPPFGGQPNTDYWTRSPATNYACNLRFVRPDGIFHTVAANDGTTGVRPVLNLSPNTPVSLAPVDGVYEISPSTETGSIQVLIEPAAARIAGAQWRLTTGLDISWQNHGDTATGLAYGTYTIAFNDITNWTRPADITIELGVGENVVETGAYSSQADPTWTNISPTDAQIIATGGEVLAASFEGIGIGLYNGNWELITPATAQALATDGNILVASVENFGTWLYDGDWRQLTHITAQLLAVDNGKVVASFEDYGIWLYDGNDWTNLTPVSAKALDFNNSKLVVSVDDYGVWLYDRDWINLTTETADIVVLDNNKLAASFTGHGIWSYEGEWENDHGIWLYEGKWEDLTTVSARALAFDNGVLAASVDGFGVWFYDGIWTNIIPATAKVLAYENELLAASFEEHGVWLYE